MNGVNGSTTFTDETGKTWTAAGNANISTAQSKFGGASGIFDGAGDYVNTSDHADFDVGNSNFTVDAWFRKAANGVLAALFSQTPSDAAAANTSMRLYLDADGANHPGLAVKSGGSSYDIYSADAITDTNWHHYAAVRNGNTAYLYIDGLSKGTPLNLTGITINNSSANPTIGRLGDYTSQEFNGYIDEFRFSKGIARWTANFIPPTAAYGTVTFIPQMGMY
jgi:hypothetical protein